MKKDLLTVFTISLFVLVVSSQSEAILLNGDFDNLDSNSQGNIFNHKQSEMTNGQWDVYDNITGWEAGNSTSGIEIQYNSVVSAHSGNFYVELDSHGGATTNSSMFQNVTLDAGSYNLGWMYHARTNGIDDNGIKAFLVNISSGNTSAIGDISKTNNQQTSLWEDIDWTFSIASAGKYQLWFEAFGTDNTLGGFIDSVALTSEPPAPVPEPATMLLFGTGLACIGGVIRRNKK